MAEKSGGQAAIAALQLAQVGHVFGGVGSAAMVFLDAFDEASDNRFVGEPRTSMKENCRQASKRKFKMTVRRGPQTAVLIKR